MAGTLTATGQNRALNNVFTTSTVTRATTWYMSLHAGANGGVGAANELSGNGYARQPVTFSVSGNVASNTSALTFGPDATANWGTVTDGCIWDSVTTGVCLAQGTVAVSTAFAVGDSATVAINAFSITLV